MSKTLISVPEFINDQIAEIGYKLAGLSYLFHASGGPNIELESTNPHPYEGISSILQDLSLEHRRLFDLMDWFLRSDLAKDTELEVDWSDPDTLGSIEKQVKDRIAKARDEKERIQSTKRG